MAGTITTAQALEDLFLQAVGTSTGTTDAFNSVSGAVNTTGVQQLLNELNGAAGLAGVGATTLQTLQQFAGSTPMLL